MRGATASFGELIRRLRREAALSQQELARRSGLSVRGISDLERGARRAPRLETVRMLADALELGAGDRTALLAAARPVAIRDGATDRPPRGPVSLPAPLTRLIGREAELAALRARLGSGDCRLLTITGAGGTGKTRLAIEVAAATVERYAAGVFFVDLSPLTDPGLVIPTIATALGVRESAGYPLFNTLADDLASKRLFLVLDNCERVLAAAPTLTMLLAASFGLTILATSREPLRVRGECEFPLLPLPLPAPDQQQPTLGEFVRNPAVALFLERAAASLPEISLTHDNAPAIGAICRRLDGLPLAIELAAAWVKVLPPTALAARLDQRLPLLTGGGRDLPARQRTMRDTIAWSYELLSSGEQALFRRLAAFAGGFTLEAAEAIAATDKAFAVLDGIAALVAQSLLRQVPGAGGEPRYLMLETVREFGLERLASSGEEADARRRHAAHFLRLSGHLVHRVQMFMNLGNLNRVADDHDNVRLALAWFDEEDEIEALLQLSATLYALWFARGLYREGSQWVERALVRAGDRVFAARVQALVAAGLLAIFQGVYDRAASLLDEGLRLAGNLGDPFLISESLLYSSLLAYRRGEYGRAEELLQEAQTHLSDVDEPHDEALPSHLAGDIALVQEHFTLAAERYEASLQRFQATGNTWQLIDAQAGLAGVRYCTGDLTGAAALYADSLQRSQRLGFTLLIVTSLLGLAAVAAADDRAVHGARLLGAAERLAESLGTPLFPRDFPVRDRGLNVMRNAIGDEQLAIAREAGRSLNVEQAVAEAQRTVEAITATASAKHA